MRAGAALEVWLGASALLCRPVLVSEPYPHIHGQQVRDGVWLGRRDCAACAEEARQTRVSAALAPSDRPPEAAP
jgi:hypothetical protein